MRREEKKNELNDTSQEQGTTAAQTGKRLEFLPVGNYLEQNKSGGTEAKVRWNPRQLRIRDFFQFEAMTTRLPDGSKLNEALFRTQNQPARDLNAPHQL